MTAIPPNYKVITKTLLKLKRLTKPYTKVYQLGILLSLQFSSASAITVDWQTISGSRYAPPSYGWNYSYDIGYFDDKLQVDIDVKLTGVDTTENLRNIWKSGFESVWSVDESRFGVAIDFNLDWVESSQDLLVNVIEDGRGNLSTWTINGTSNQSGFAAHELGHQMGLFDEYRVDIVDDATGEVTGVIEGALDPNHPNRVNTGGIMATLSGDTLNYYYDDFLDWHVENVLTPAAVLSITGRFFYDDDDNVVNSAGDRGVAGATVSLYQGSAQLDTTVTDANGDYEFSGVADGWYKVRFTKPTGSDFVEANYGGSSHEGVHSDVRNFALGETEAIEVAGASATNVNAGLIVTDLPNAPIDLGISGRYFVDTNGNNLEGGGEPGIENIRIRIKNVSSNVWTNVYTDSNGEYSIELNAGTYFVLFPPDPNGGVFVIPNTGSNSSVDSDVIRTWGNGSGPTANIVVSNAMVTDIDAGVDTGVDPNPTPPAPNAIGISGRYFVDSNANNMEDSGETGIGGVVIQVNRVSDKAKFYATTNEQGEYEIDLDPDIYEVRFPADPNGGMFVLANQGTNDELDSDVIKTWGNGVGPTAHIQVLDSMITNVDAGVDGGVDPEPSTGGISGRYFIDTNGDEKENYNEPGILGLRVVIKRIGDNASFDAYTSSTGTYTVDLEPGTYQVRFPADPNGGSFVTPNVGNATAVDSDVIQTWGNGVGPTANIIVTDSMVTDIDAGVTP